MTIADLIQNAAGNLWRMKLRALLTIAGVLIAIAAFVSMLSFGAGMQDTVSDRFEQLGLFTTMYVYPTGKGSASFRRSKRHQERVESKSDSSEVEALPLDSAAVEFLATIPGVKLAYPYENMSVTVALRDSTFESEARAVPISAITTKMFSQFLAGKAFESDSARSVLVTERFLLDAGLSLDSAEALLADTIIVAVEVVSLDSAITRLLFNKDFDSLKAHFKDMRFDSLGNSEYRGRLLGAELSGALERFIDGYLNSREQIAETLTIAGVIEGDRHGNLIRPIVLPEAAGQRLSEAGFSGSQQDLLTSLASGHLPGMGGSGISAEEYSRVTLDLDQATPYESIKDSVEALGFDTYSFAEEFTEIQKVFLFFNMALGMIGLIALVTAGLGIVNTMVMSILERRREIGVLKSLGADDSDIKLMYLFESAMIGSVGSVGGIVLGWLITRGAALVADWYMRSRDFPQMEFFALPFWLILIAFAIGLTISVLAGLYPASRAAKVDPVQALRSD